MGISQTECLFCVALICSEKYSDTQIFLSPLHCTLHMRPKHDHFDTRDEFGLLDLSEEYLKKKHSETWKIINRINSRIEIVEIFKKYMKNYSRIRNYKLLSNNIMIKQKRILLFESFILIFQTNSIELTTIKNKFLPSLSLETFNLVKIFMLKINSVNLQIKKNSLNKKFPHEPDLWSIIYKMTYFVFYIFLPLTGSTFTSFWKMYSKKSFKKLNFY